MLRIIGYIFGLLLVAGVGVAVAAYLHFSADLPDYSQLERYDPPIVTRVHAGDGRLMAEYATENRFFVPITAIPKRLTEAFLSSEDKTFYEHAGIDVPGIVQATITNLSNKLMGRDRRPVGASTITQQVAKNFLLSNELSYQRKLREILLALRIEKAFTKDRIFELYLNEIYLGAGSYGVAAAAINYFNKSLDELSIGEAAYLAGLPKAPEQYNLKKTPAAALARRDWVLARMLEDGYLTREQYEAAKAEPLQPRPRWGTETVRADYFAEELRRELAERFGDKALYEGGLSVHSTLDPKLQRIADRALRLGLMRYDRKHGYRGPIAKIEPGLDWEQKLAAVQAPPGLYDWKLAAVLEVEKDAAVIGLLGGEQGSIPLGQLTWARKQLKEGRLGRGISSAADVLAVGDVVIVEPVTADPEGNAYPEHSFALRQIPEVSGALVAMDPQSGRVLALNGGWSYEISEFNRATQALRQPGSAFKPFVYIAALESGFTPSSIVVDGPIAIEQGPGLPLWQPENYTDKYYGPSTLRLGVEKSRNLMTVRLAQHIGMERVAEYAERFGIVDHMPRMLAMSLGSGETTVLRMTAGFSMIVNGGKRIQPTLIERVQDRRGLTVYRHDNRPCEACQNVAWQDQPPPELPDVREQIVDPGTAYQMVSILEGVVQRGTGTAVKEVGKPLAGKTGTTNESRDAWFVGFSPDLAVGVYVGFDNPRTLGHDETGGSVAAPIFRDFMMEALKDKPAIPFRVPPGIKLVRVNAITGQRAQAGDPKIILEAFKPGTEPNGQMVVIDGFGVETGGAAATPSMIPAGSTGGLY